MCVSRLCKERERRVSASRRQLLYVSYRYVVTINMSIHLERLVLSVVPENET